MAMSSLSESATPEDRSQFKKRRIPGACDLCKRKKVRCDSGELPGNRCSNCSQLGVECTHKELTKTLGPAKGYVESLEARLEKMDKLLRKLLPGVNLNQEIDLDKKETETTEPIPLPRNDDENEMMGKLSRLTLNPNQNRFFGKSSQYQLVQTALDLRQEFTGEGIAYVKPVLPTKRREFWDVPPWVTNNPVLDEDHRVYTFPDNDLSPSLLDGYFTHINTFLPLLHRPTFEKQLSAGLHHRESMFAKVFLLVCAHGARHSDDPRVSSDSSASSRSAGWKWFEQVDVLRKNLYNRTVLHELQMQALYVLFAQASETPQGIWAQIGMALRLSQEVGGHRRRRTESTFPTAEDELWKRAFWVILSLDRLISSTAGRPCGLQDEDFDLDLPLECDDEYWDKGFVQPEGHPSFMAYFNCYLSLMDILAYAMRLVYSTKRPKYAREEIPKSEQQIIAELDSAMNNWMDSVPDHLRWNPNCKNELFLKQSSALHATYYHLQILIHRPFIPSPRNPFPVKFPSLAICTNAARSCCHVLEVHSRASPLPLAALQATTFVSAVILLLNIWSGKRSGFAPNPRREMEDVQRCMDMLKASEKRCASAGRYLDLLSELASAGEMNTAFQQNTTPKTKKRQRSDADDTDDSPTFSYTPPHVPESRNIAGTRRVSLTQHSNNPATSPVEPPIKFLLPMYSNDLGRLPVYGQFNFADTADAFLVDQRGQIQTSIPTKTSNNYHFDQAPDNIFTSDPSSDIVTAAENFSFDDMLKDAIFNSQVNEFNSNQNQQQQVVTDDINAIFAECSNNLGSLSQFNGVPMVDKDMLTMWYTAPASLELDEWGTFISNVEQLTQARRLST